MNPYKDKDLKSFIDSIPSEEIDRQNQLQEEENRRVFKEFIDALKIGKCFLCGGQMNSFDESNPCFHWFTYPHGIRKKHFEKYLSSPIGFFQLDSYFRWLANTEKPLGNINDLKEDLSSTSYIETTYRYKNVEWAFSIGHTDVEGHPNGRVGSKPHYHLQMQVDGRPFLGFNDFHIPFSDSDLFTISVLEQAGDKVKLAHSFGEGIGILEDEEKLKIIDDLLSVADDEEKAPINRQTFIQAPEGQTISGEVIQQAIDESERTKKPVGKILQRLLAESGASVVSIISPGKGVPSMKKRSGKK